ncbi:MAG: protein kinase, partial [Planctomycetota bacterium]|nr:protein kinase [Planctomycetota bacterium]
MPVPPTQPSFCPTCGKHLQTKNLPPRARTHCPTCSSQLVQSPDTTPTLTDAVRRGSPAGGSPESDEKCRTFGHFQLLEELGRGGMGVVWKAWDSKTNRNVALKVLPHSGQVSAETKERFLREARLAARLRHPGIVAVHDVG